MNSRKEGFTNLVVILAVVGVLLVGGGIIAFNYFLSSSPTNLKSSAYSPTPLNIKTPKSDTETGFKPSEEKPKVATPSATPTVPAPLPKLITPSNVSGQVYVTTTLSSDKKTFTIDFKSTTNFSGLTSISYSLTYTADSGPRGIQGTFAVGGDISPITKNLTLGTCSTGGTCVYDANPKNFRLTVTTK